jgi:hypothetical protein
MSTHHESVEIELDLTTISAADLEGDNNPPPGKYHARIEDVQHVSDQKPYLKVRFALLAGTDPEGVGCALHERFYLSEKARPRVANLVRRLKLIGDDAFGGRTTVYLGQAIGQQLIVQVIEEEYPTKDGGKGKHAKLSFMGFWNLADERVKDVPRDASAARQASTPPPPPKHPGGGKKAPAGDDWGEI